DQLDAVVLLRYSVLLLPLAENLGHVVLDVYAPLSMVGLCVDRLPAVPAARLSPGEPAEHLSRAERGGTRSARAKPAADRPLSPGHAWPALRSGPYIVPSRGHNLLPYRL